MNPTRAQLRQHYKHQRTAMSPVIRAAANDAITHHLTAHFTQPPGNIMTIGVFMAMACEVDLGLWVVAHTGQGGRAALPRIGVNGDMAFHEYDVDAHLEPNHYGIAEPGPAVPLVAAADLDAVLVPLVAFDNNGTRLGMGGGYYDRYLVSLRDDAITMGVAFACQHSADDLPRESWDVPLHAVVTENGVLKLN